MEENYTYTLKDVTEAEIESKHGQVSLEQMRFVLKYINDHLLKCVKTNLEFILHGSCKDIITLTSGEGCYKFLATYDYRGNHKVRRFIGQSKLRPKQEALSEETHKEVNENTIFRFQKKIRSVHRPGKAPKNKFDEERESSSKGLLCMKAAYAIIEKDISMNVEVAFFDGNDDLYIIKSEKTENKVLATFDKLGNPEVLFFVERKYSIASEVNMYIYDKCTEVSKISIGKLMVEVCGNEGADDDENTAFIRQYLQAIITHLKEEKDKVWKNAKITIYDKKFNSLILKTGKGDNEFVVTGNGQGELCITKAN